MISAIIQNLVARVSAKHQFRKDIRKELEEFAVTEINAIEGAIVLARTGVPEAIPALYRALNNCEVFAICESENKPTSYTLVHSPGNFRAYVVFTTWKRADVALSTAKSGAAIKRSFREVLDALPFGLGIVINPMDLAVRLDIDPPDIAKFTRSMMAETEAVRGNQPPPLPAMQPEEPQPVRLSIGPSPWAFVNRSTVVGGATYRFRQTEPNDSKLSGLTSLQDAVGNTLLILDFQYYARILDDGTILLWHESSDKESKLIKFYSFPLLSLQPIPEPLVVAAQLREGNLGISSLPVSQYWEFKMRLEPGMYSLEIPYDWSGFEETLVLADHADSNGHDEMSRAIFAFDWLKQRVEVFPQD